MEIVADVVLEKAEPIMAEEVGDVFRPAGDEVVHANDMVALSNEGVRQVAAKKTSSASY
jgi:hypothetical protein